jgi:hypothetical protein
MTPLRNGSDAVAREAAGISPADAVHAAGCRGRGPAPRSGFAATSAADPGASLPGTRAVHRDNAGGRCPPDLDQGRVR